MGYFSPPQNDSTLKESNHKFSITSVSNHGEKHDKRNIEPGNISSTLVRVCNYKMNVHKKLIKTGTTNSRDPV